MAIARRVAPDAFRLRVAAQLLARSGQVPVAERAAPIPWSIKALSVAGIDVYVHATFVLLFVWLATIQWLDTHQLMAVVSSVAFLAALFGCVLLHEFGHALVARRYGIATQEITLLPIGGIARMARLPERPSETLVIALAGPAVNLALAAVLFVLVKGGVIRGAVVDELLFANLILALFNLLPAFPMDGGRALQAALAPRLGALRAMRIATTMGQVMALGFAVIGLRSNPVLFVIAVFVWIGAGQEAVAVEIRALLSRLTARDLANVRYQIVAADEHVEQVARLMLRTSISWFVVISGGDVIGVLSGDAIVASVKASPRALIQDVLTPRRPVVVTSDTAADRLLPLLQASGREVVLVVDGDRFAGIVTMTSLATLLALHRAIGDRVVEWLGHAPHDAASSSPTSRFDERALG